MRHDDRATVLEGRQRKLKMVTMNPAAADTRECAGTSVLVESALLFVQRGVALRYGSSGRSSAAFRPSLPALREVHTKDFSLVPHHVMGDEGSAALFVFGAAWHWGHRRTRANLTDLRAARSPKTFDAPDYGSPGADGGGADAPGVGELPPSRLSNTGARFSSISGEPHGVLVA